MATVANELESSLKRAVLALCEHKYWLFEDRAGWFIDVWTPQNTHKLGKIALVLKADTDKGVVGVYFANIYPGLFKSGAKPPKPLHEPFTIQLRTNWKTNEKLLDEELRALVGIEQATGLTAKR